jgi:hypothetical protein
MDKNLENGRKTAQIAQTAIKDKEFAAGCREYATAAKLVFAIGSWVLLVELRRQTS